MRGQQDASDTAAEPARSDSGALAGVKVLDLSRFIAGPLCAQNLGDFGAEVVKVERPGGEDTRFNEPQYNGKSLYTALFNRNKRNITLDTRSSQGKRVLRKLVAWADVLVENFRPGTLDKMGLDAATRQEVNSRLIVVSISGFGGNGPYQDRVLFDCIAQAMSGLMDMNAQPDGQPMLTKIFPADSLAANYATTGAVTALFHRERSGHGQMVDVSVFDALTSAMGTTLPGYVQTGEAPAHNGNRDDYNAPANLFPTADGYVYLHAGTNTFWQRLCTDILEKPELSDDPRFDSVQARMAHIDEAESIVTGWTSTRAATTVEDVFRAAGIPCAVVADIPTAARNEQMWARDMLMNTVDSEGDEVVLYGNPVKLSASPAGIRYAPGRVGEYTDAVLVEAAGLSRDEVAMLHEEGVV